MLTGSGALLMIVSLLLTGVCVLGLLYAMHKCTPLDQLSGRPVYVKMPGADEEWLRMSLSLWNAGDQMDPGINLGHPASLVRVGSRYLVSCNLTEDVREDTTKSHKGVTLFVLDSRGGGSRAYYPNYSLDEATEREAGSYKWLLLDPRSSDNFDVSEPVGEGREALLKEYRIMEAYKTITDAQGLTQSGEFPAGPIGYLLYTVHSISPSLSTGSDSDKSKKKKKKKNCVVVS
ncbi:MAG: hypothetical protein ACO38I_05540 [Ilumatobacteraceae bacterium]